MVPISIERATSPAGTPATDIAMAYGMYLSCSLGHPVAESSAQSIVNAAPGPPVLVQMAYSATVGRIPSGVNIPLAAYPSPEPSAAVFHSAKA